MFYKVAELVITQLKCHIAPGVYSLFGLSTELLKLGESNHVHNVTNLFLVYQWNAVVHMCERDIMY